MSWNDASQLLIVKCRNEEKTMANDVQREPTGKVASLRTKQLERKEEIHISSSALSYVSTELLCRDKNDELDDNDNHDDEGERMNTFWHYTKESMINQSITERSTRGNIIGYDVA